MDEPKNAVRKFTEREEEIKAAVLKAVIDDAEFRATLRSLLGHL